MHIHPTPSSAHTTTPPTNAHVNHGCASILLEVADKVAEVALLLPLVVSRTVTGEPKMVAGENNVVVMDVEIVPFIGSLLTLVEVIGGFMT